MFVIGGLIIGLITGTYSAKRRGGSAADMAQYAAAHAMVLMVIGLGITIFLDRYLSA